MLAVRRKCDVREAASDFGRSDALTICLNVSLTEDSCEDSIINSIEKRTKKKMKFVFRSFRSTLYGVDQRFDYENCFFFHFTFRFFKKLRSSRFRRLKIILKSFFSQFLKRSWYFFHSCNSYNSDHLSKSSKIKLKMNFNCSNASEEKKNMLSKKLHSISNDQMHWRNCLMTDQSDFIDSTVAF